MDLGYRSAVLPILSTLASVAGNAALRLDSWVNAVTGLGTSRFDKGANASHTATGLYGDAYLEELYNDDPIAALVCEKIPDEMFRAGFELHVNLDKEDENGDLDALELATELTRALYELKYVEAIKSAKVWERCMGGAVVLPLIDDGITDPSKPLNEKTIRAVGSAIVSDKSRIFARRWYPPGHPKAGWPETYTIQMLTGFVGDMSMSAFQQMFEIHESRLLVFPGGRVTQRRRIAQFGWGRSTLATLHDVLRDYGMSWNGLSHMLQSASQDKWKIKGLHAALMSGDQKAKQFFLERLQLSQLTMGINRGVMLDSDGEDLDRIATQFTGIADVIEKMEQRVCAAIGAPMTVVFGRSPHGLAASGAEEMQAWYDTCAARQVEELDPPMKRSLDLIMRDPNGPTGGRVLDVTIAWKPLKQLSPTEQADLRFKQAEVDQIEFNMGAISAEEVAINRHGPEGWSAETKIDIDLRRKMLEADQEQALEQAKNPPPPEPPPQDPPPAPPGKPGDKTPPEPPPKS